MDYVYPHRPAVVATCLILCWTLALPASAQDVWIGNPTPADYFRKHLQDAIATLRATKQAAGKLSDQIEDARITYFSAGLSSAERAEAGEQFSKALLGKDLTYLGLYLGEGITDRTQTLARIMGSNGEFVDKGIPKPAWEAFATWVDAVRGSLGAKRPGDLAFAMGDTSRLMQALESNKDLYDTYKLLRDQAEREAWKRRYPYPVYTRGHAPLMAQKIVGLPSIEALKSLYFVPERNAELDARLREAGGQGQQILYCTYGPTATPYGRGNFWYGFWYKQPPRNLEALREVDPKGSLRYLGNKGFVACPAGDAEAFNLRQAMTSAMGYPAEPMISQQVGDPNAKSSVDPPTTAANGAVAIEGARKQEKPPAQATPPGENSVAVAKSEDGSFPLHTERSIPLKEATAIAWGQLSQPIRSLLRQANADGQQVLDCSYGPIGRWTDGTPKFKSARFWKGATPRNIEQLLEADNGAFGKFSIRLGGGPAYPFAQLGSRTALDKCPATDRQAEDVGAS